MDDTDGDSRISSILPTFLFFRFFEAIIQNQIKNMKKQLPNIAVVRVEINKIISFILSPKIKKNRIIFVN